MTKQKTTSRFAICISSDDPDLLTPRMIYEVLPDESAARSDYIRVIDNEGEDYLYPADRFVYVEFPQVVQRALSRVSDRGIGSPSPGRRRKVSSAKRQGKTGQRAA